MCVAKRELPGTQCTLWRTFSRPKLAHEPTSKPIEPVSGTEGPRGVNCEQYHHADGAVVVTNYANTPEQVNATLEAPLKVENMQEIEVGTLVFGHHAIQRGHVQKVPHPSNPPDQPWKCR